MTDSHAALGTVDVLVFAIGRTEYAADASQVLRIDRATFKSKLADSLGMPTEGQRALVFNTDAGEAELCVDAVVGVRSVHPDELRRLPPAAGRSRGVLGFWLAGGERPVVLLDLPNTLDAPGGQ